MSLAWLAYHHLAGQAPRAYAGQ